MLNDLSPIGLVAVGGAVLVAAVLLATGISRWIDWRPAGPIALIAAAPLVPRIPLLFSLSLDDLTPLVGLNIFLASYRFKRPVLEVCRAALPMMAILGAGVLVITYVPWLTTGLLTLLGRE